MKILIAVPTFETITPDTFKSIFDLDKCGHDVSFEFVRGYDCATARNKIAKKALDLEADYVLMVDNDITLPQETLRYLLEDPKDVCLGYYAHRNEDNRYHGRTCICKLEDEYGTEYYNYPLESEYTASEMEDMKQAGITKLRVHGGGMGCALIKVEMFEKIRYPWYDWINYGDENKGMLSEDLYFCEKCKDIGTPIYTDTRAGCGHLFRYVQWPIREETCTE